MIRKGSMDNNILTVKAALDDYAMARDLLNSHPASYKIVRFLLQYGGPRGTVLVSNDSIAELTCQSASTVKRALKVLQARGWLQVRKIGTSSLFFLRSPDDGPDNPPQSRSIDARIIFDLDKRDATATGKA